MALWGNNDNIDSAGTVQINFYDQGWTGTGRTERTGDNQYVGITTAEVVGSGTSFGATSNAQIGDVIRFGDPSTGGTYYGDAVIVGIASATVLSIAATTGLKNQAAKITGVQYLVSQAPVYTIDDPSFSANIDSAAGLTTTAFKGTVSSAVGVGTSAFALSNMDDTNHPNVGDVFTNDSDAFVVTSVGGGNASSLKAVGIGSTTIRANRPAGLEVGDVLDQGGSAYTITGLGETQAKVGTAGVGTDIIPLLGGDNRSVLVGDNIITPLNGSLRITAVTGTASVTVASTIGNAATGLAATISNPTIINLNTGIGEATTAAGIVTFKGITNGAFTKKFITGVYDGGGVSAAIDASSSLEFQRYQGGYDKYVYGIGVTGSEAASGTVFETGVGWVGVTTYRDSEGDLRVKKEILVAMSGIQTGTNSDLYPPHQAT